MGKARNAVSGSELTGCCTVLCVHPIVTDGRQEPWGKGEWEVIGVESVPKEGRYLGTASCLS